MCIYIYTHQTGRIRANFDHILVKKTTIWKPRPARGGLELVYIVILIENTTVWRPRPIRADRGQFSLEI